MNSSATKSIKIIIMLQKMSFIILMFTFSQLSYSQINFGLKAGVNYSNFGFSPKSNHSFPDGYFGYMVSYQAGIFSTINLNSTVSIDPEFLATVKGSYHQDIDLSPGYTTSLFYINLPLLIGIHPTNSLAIQVGPELGYLVVPFSSSGTEDLNLFYNKFDFGLVIGAKYFLTHNIGFGFRYCHGISPLYNIEFRDTSGNTTDIVKVQNKSFQLSANYLFN